MSGAQRSNANDYIILDLLYTGYLWPLRSGWVLILGLSNEVYLQNFKCEILLVAFIWYGQWECLARKQIFTLCTSWITNVMTRFDPKHIWFELGGEVFVLLLYFWWIFFWYWGFCHGTPISQWIACLFVQSTCTYHAREYHLLYSQFKGEILLYSQFSVIGLPFNKCIGERLLYSQFSWG